VNDQPNDTMKSGKRIIYILGAGRSGTTITDVILCNAPQIESLGEIFRFPELNGKPHGFESGSTCYKFWANISKKFQELSPLSLDELHNIAHDIEYHSNFLKTYWEIGSKEYKKKYATYVNTFFNTVFNHIDKNIVIDSSMYPGRAIALSRAVEHEISFIYIRRDPSSVVHSFQKKGIEQPSKTPLGAITYYFIVNMMCRITTNYLKENGFKVIDIKFEDLINEPLSTLNNIENAIKIDLGKVKEIVKGKEYLSVGNLFEGNRIRLKNKIKLRKNVNIGSDTYLLNKLNYLLYK